jgi:hypothetical protein
VRDARHCPAGFDSQLDIQGGRKTPRTEADLNASTLTRNALPQSIDFTLVEQIMLIEPAVILQGVLIESTYSLHLE